MTCCDSKRNGEDKTPLENDLEGLICYCFNHSKRELLKAVQDNKEKEIIDDIKFKMKDPGCSCETLNPSGKCCLPDIKKLISDHKK